MSQNAGDDLFLKVYNRRMGLPEDYVHGQEEQPVASFSPLSVQQDVSAAESVAPDSITDMGEVETIDLSSPDTAQPGATLPTDTVVDVLSTWKSPTDARADFEAESLPQTLHALHNSLNVNPFELKDLADRAGLTYSVVDADSGFARKKIASDRHAEVLRGFMDNISQTPKTAAFVRQADSVEQLALTSDVALAALEKDLDPAQRGFFDSGYIGAARNAWNNGMLAREVGDLAVKWMDGSITDDEHRRLDALRQAQTYFQQQRENMGLLERMVRGSVEALGVPLAGGVAGAVQFLGRYGKEGLAGGAMLGAGVGTAAGGAGAVPGAILGGVTGLSAVAQAGFMNDMMRQEGAQTFLSLVDMGVPEDTARVLAIAAGGAKGLLEYVGLREVGRVFPGAEKFLTREAATAALNTLKRNPSLAAALGDAGLAALRGIAGETGTEVLQEGVDIVAEDTGRRLSGVNRAAPTLGEIGARLADTAIQTIESTALVAGAGGAARGARNYARNNRRESLLAQIQDAQSRTLDTVAQAAQNSPVMKDMAGTGEALMQHLADAGVTPETLYIRPEAVQQMFFQEENPELMAAAADMGITPESLQENLTLGTDVAVDFAKATRHIMADPQRYEALRQDMRLEPSMLTDAEVEYLAAMNQDAEARLAYLDNLLAPVSEEAQAAQTRYDQRMETAAPYVEQLRQAGYSENQANAFGLVLAANAEHMAPVFGLTPQEYLAQRFAGYHSMTQEEFERLASGGLDGLFENRELASMLQDMGVTKNMSRSRKRRQLQPEFDYAYGRVDAESVKSLYGQERVNELRRQFGPGFFARKGEGTPLDVLAQNFAREERGGYELGAEDIDADAFAEKIFAPHDEFEAGLAGQLRQRMLWQEQTAAEKLAQDVAAWRQAVDAVAASGKPPSSPVQMLTQTPLVLQLLGEDSATGKAAAEGGIYAAPHMFGGKHPNITPDILKQLPAALVDPIAVFDSDNPRNRAKGDVVFMLGVKDAKGATVVVPVALQARTGSLKGVQVNIATSAYAKENSGKPSNSWFREQAQKNARYVNGQKMKAWQYAAGVYFPFGTISNASGNTVRTEADLVNLWQQNPTFYQLAYHGTPHRFDQFTLDHIGEGEGAQAHGWGLYFAESFLTGKRYREKLTASDIVVNGQAYTGPEGTSREGLALASNALRAASSLKTKRGQVNKAIRLLEDNPSFRIDDKWNREAVAVLESLRNQDFSLGGIGQLFAVDIPENDVLLDEQKSISEQPGIVKQAFLQAQKEFGVEKPLYVLALDAISGRSFYEDLEKALGSPKAASLWLNDHGVKGITYNGRQDGRCFVVFDDEAVKVLETYYQNEEDAVQTPEQTYASGMAAMNSVIAEHTDALDAMFRPEVGSISFYWGQEGKGPKGKGGSGVAHIIARRNAEGKDGEAVARKMVEVLAYGEIGPEYGPQDGQHRNVSFDGHTAVLSLYRFGNRQTWLLTGWEDNPAGETGTVNAPSPTQASPSGIRDRLGAAESSVGNTVRPLGADGKPLFSRVSPGRARGAMSRLPDGRAVVGLFKSKNASTVLHETAHFWLEELREAAQLDTAPDWVRDVWGKLQKAYGFEGALNGLNDVARWTEVQERFAREFEAYARDGKAPSWELQSAFNRFRNWLTEIYRSVRAVLGMNDVSEDVREVFDALLATQEEIEQSQRAVAADSVMELLDEKETTPELRDRYARAAQRAYENASAVIANRRLVDRRAAEKEIRQQVTAEIDGSETYTMLARLREGGLDFDALKAAISEDVAYRLREKWHAARGEGKALIRKGGALDLLDVAAQFDQDSVQGLAGALLDTPTRREAIGAETERRLAQWDARYNAEVEYSNAWDAALAVELEALTGQRQISPAQLRQQMDERTGVKKMSAVDAEYKTLKARLQSDERAARRAWNAAKREAGAAAREKIAALKEQERLRRAALGAAYRARMERDNIILQLRKIGNSKSVPYDYMCQIRRLLQRWDGLGTEGQRLDPATLRGLKSLQEFLAEKSADSLFDEPLTAPDWLLADQTGRFSDLSIEQMRDVKRLIQELAHAGRTEGRMLADKEKREIKAVADECAAAAMQLSARDYISDRAGVLDTIKGALRKGLSSLTSVRFLARALDGFNDHGVNHDAWLMPLQMARTEELTLQREMEEKLREALKPLLRVGQLQKAFSIDGVPLRQDVSRQWAGMWDMDKVYSVALNMGNEGNLKALMQGYGWSGEDLQAITARLTAEEWQAVQAVWDAIDTLYPRLNDVYKTLKGVPLPKVKAQAFTVQTADGQTLTLKGGYYPLIFDQRLSDKAAENQSVDELLNGMEAVLRSPNPKNGFTKERKGSTLPPKLSLTVLDRHVTDTVHYITHALPLRDTMRLFREPSFRDAFVRAAGQENYDQLLPWLRGIARPGGEQAQGLVKAIDWLARRGSLYALGLNMKSALLQLTSIGNSWSEVGFGNFLRAAATMLSAPHQSWNTVREKSAYMQNRARLLDDTLRREYEEMQGRGVRGLSFGGRRFSLDVARQAQMALMIAMDAAVAYPTWLAAYDKAIARGADEARAVAEADGAVVAAQGGGGPLDTPETMRKATLTRALCPFMSFALSDFNRKMETIRGFAEWAKTGHSSVTPARLFRDFALQWVLPVTLSVLMVSLGRDGEPPEGEDFLWEALTFYTMGIPIVRDVAKPAESYFSEHGYKGGRSPLMLAGLDNAVRGLWHAYKAWDEGDPDAEYRAMKETLNAVGFALGLGTPQIWRTLEGSEAYWIDDEGGPLAPLLGKPQE